MRTAPSPNAVPPCLGTRVSRWIDPLVPFRPVGWEENPPAARTLQTRRLRSPAEPGVTGAPLLRRSRAAHARHRPGSAVRGKGPAVPRPAAGVAKG
jgi:hypothetical protein